jgi:hypothetical protein
MRRSPLRQLVLTAGIAAVIAACGNTKPSEPRLPELSFDSAPPIRLDVAQIEVVAQFAPQATGHHIEVEMPVSPETALRRWVRDRLKAVGTTGTLRVLITDASATETPLPVESGVTGLFKRDPPDRVDVSLNVSIQILDDRQFVVTQVGDKASRGRTEPDGQSLNDHDRMLYDMVSDLMNGFNSEMQQNITATFGRWIKI